MKRIGSVSSALWVSSLTAAFTLAGSLQTFNYAQDADKRVVLKVTVPGGRQVKVTEAEGGMASVTTPSLSVGLTPTVKGDLVTVAIHKLDEAGKPAEKPLATVTGEVGQALTVQFGSADQELRIVPERVY
jgi:hypothetical protein